MLMKGYISGYDGQALNITVPFSDAGLLQKQEITECEVRLTDGRTITPAQRRKIFAMVRDIADWATWAKDRRQYQEVLRQLQLLYLIDTTDTEAVRHQLEYHYCELLDINLFSLSNCDVSTAREFISYLIDLAIEHEIPCRDSLLNRCEDIERYLYSCVERRRCAICGKKADIHEVERVGMGRDRRQLHHLGQLVQPLCRQHHQEVDQVGQASFDKKYHITGIRLDENLCKKLKWRI